MNLFRAASLGDIESLKKIISSGVDVNEIDDANMPPIAYSKNAAVANALLDAGAFVTGMASEMPIVHKLIDRVSSGDSEASALSIVVRHDGGLNSDWNGFNGDYAIHAATRTGNKTIIKMIVDAGGNLNLLSNEGESAFGIAATLGNDDLLELLIDLSDSPPTNDHFCVNTSVIDAAAAEEMIDYAFSLVDWAFNHSNSRILNKLATIGIYPDRNQSEAITSSSKFFMKDPRKYSESDFTKWFPPNTLPVHSGVYEVTPNPKLSLGNAIYASWENGKHWSNASPDPDDLLDSPSFSGREWFWRGLKDAM